jgi:hypothetical protein
MYFRLGPESGFFSQGGALTCVGSIHIDSCLNILGAVIIVAVLCKISREPRSIHFNRGPAVVFINN